MDRKQVIFSGSRDAPRSEQRTGLNRGDDRRPPKPYLASKLTRHKPSIGRLAMPLAPQRQLCQFLIYNMRKLLHTRPTERLSSELAHLDYILHTRRSVFCPGAASCHTWRSQITTFSQICASAPTLQASTREGRQRSAHEKAANEASASLSSKRFGSGAPIGS